MYSKQHVDIFFLLGGEFVEKSLQLIDLLFAVLDELWIRSEVLQEKISTPMLV